MRRLVLVPFVALAICLSTGSAGATAADERFEEAARVLERAFENRFDLDMKAEIELVMRSRRGGSRRRVFEVVSKRKGGRLHSIGRLVAPAHLRGMTIMSLEVEGGGEDTFVYMPSLKKVRRVSSAQRGDSFLGSDLTYEDFERRRAEDFVITGMTRAELGGEPVHRIMAYHRQPQSYDRLEMDVAVADDAILETRYYKRDAEVPYRRTFSRREAMIEADGHVIPTHVMAQNELRGTETEVHLRNLEVNPQLEDHLFSMATLESQRPIH